MLHRIAKLGGLPIMMGRHDRSESLFYYFRIEDQVPETHLLVIEWGQCLRLQPPRNTWSFAKIAEHEIMVFSVSMAISTGFLSCDGQLPTGVIVSGETHEFPASG